MPAPATPPIDLYDYWHTQYLTGPGPDPQSYFDDWFAHLKPTFDSFPLRPGSEKPVIVHRQQTFDDRMVEFHFRNLDDKSSGAMISYLVTIDDGGNEQTWAILTGLIDLDEAWRFDLIESFDGEPTYEMVKDIVTRYWLGTHAPRLLMQIDARTKGFFFVPREEN